MREEPPWCQKMLFWIAYFFIIMIYFKRRSEYPLRARDRWQCFMSVFALLYRVFIKYCVFSKILKYIPDFGLSRCVHWTSCLDHKMQVEHQRCIRTGRVKKSHNILRENTIFKQHPVLAERQYILLCVTCLTVYLNGFFLSSFSMILSCSSRVNPTLLHYE